MCSLDDEEWFFFLLSCRTLRSRFAGIQINSIERSPMVPLRPARKLKLTIECVWEGERERGRGIWRKEKRGRRRWMKEKKISGEWKERQRWWVDKRITKTLGEKNKHNGQQTAEGKNTQQDLALSVIPPTWRQGEGGAKEGRGRRGGGVRGQLDQCQIISYVWIHAHGSVSKLQSCHRKQGRCVRLCVTARAIVNKQGQQFSKEYRVYLPIYCSECTSYRVDVVFFKKDIQSL